MGVFEISVVAVFDLIETNDSTMNIRSNIKNSEDVRV